MTRVFPWIDTNGLFGRPRYGISHDDPGITASEKLTYDGAVEVPNDFKGAGEYQMTVLPGGSYAAGKFKGTDKQVVEAWSWMLRKWLPESGMQLDARPCFEHYPVGRDLQLQDRRVRVRDLYPDNTSMTGPPIDQIHPIG